jgi:hypothetical protein
MDASPRQRGRSSADEEMSTIKRVLIALALTGVLLACAGAEIAFAPATPVAEGAAK